VLHELFNEEMMDHDEAIIEVHQLLDRYANKLSTMIVEDGQSNELWMKYEVWTLGLKASLDELIASQYAAKKFRHAITSTTIDAMSAEEKLNYARYVYFDKNGFIRVFSLLDKLGTFLNELLQLKTEKIKAYFSYFTVLRNLRENKLHSRLTIQLNEIKEANKEATNRLRKRRNTEIHYMNSEMQDDLIQKIRMYGERIQLENLDQQIQDLEQGLQMSIQSIKLSIEYAEKLLRN